MGGLDVQRLLEPASMNIKRSGGLNSTIRRAQEGDVDAFAELVERHAPELHRLAAAIVGPDDAADATQEALLSAWRQLPRLHSRDSFHPWLRAILVNRCRNVLRGRSRRLPGVLDFDRGFEPADPGPPVDARLTEQDTLDAAFEILSPDQRALLSLHYTMDLSIRESAEALGIPTGTAKSRLNGALEALRAALSPEVES
jgi:RNA polymerase sigma-70 factor (ECF subfamily)